MDVYREKISSTLKDIRFKLDVTQWVLADLFNQAEPATLVTNRRDVSRYEMGTTVCPADKFLKFISLAEGIPEREERENTND